MDWVIFYFDLSGETSLSIWKSMDQGANITPFLGDGIRGDFFFIFKERNNYFFVNRKNIIYTLSAFPKIVRQSADHTASLSQAAPSLRGSTYSTRLTG